jgi:YD repeat-containing protein
VSINTSTNFIADDSRPVVFTATAPGYDPVNAVLQVIDADGTYRFTAAGQMISESFNSFSGDHDPAPWITTGGEWLSMEAGQNTSAGFRAYGTANDGSLGFSGISAPGVATANFKNDSPTNLTSLQVAFTAEQWRAVSGGSADSIGAQLIVDGVPQPIPSLDFTAATNLPTGPITGATISVRSTIISGLSIPPGSSFGLRFTFTPGPGSGPLSDEVFINEFHNDNFGGDTNEYVEIVTGPAFSEPLSSVRLILYNGANGTTYGATTLHDLSTFEVGDMTSSGHRIYIKNFTPTSTAIQNGDPDGFALTVRGVVRQFISYGGTFTATNGVAKGLPSLDIGVKQSAEVAGQASIDYSGSGSSPPNFGWLKFLGSPYTFGHPNTGQPFFNPLQPQGFGIDNISVTFLSDNDLDGIPDLLDPDDDNDGQTDIAEGIFGSDPLTGNSFYRPVTTQTSPTGETLTFDTLVGRPIQGGKQHQPCGLDARLDDGRNRIVT